MSSLWHLTSWRAAFLDRLEDTPCSQRALFCTSGPLSRTLTLLIRSFLLSLHSEDVHDSEFTYLAMLP
jgi:hypothetical protein